MVLNKVRRHSKVGLVTLAYVAFVALGMPTGSPGAAWRLIRTGFSVPLDTVVPGLPGVLARWFSPEVVSIGLVVVFLALLGLYRWSTIPKKRAKESG